MTTQEIKLKRIEPSHDLALTKSMDAQCMKFNGDYELMYLSMLSHAGNMERSLAHANDELRNLRGEL